MIKEAVTYAYTIIIAYMNGTDTAWFCKQYENAVSALPARGPRAYSVLVLML